jgi:GTP-sensing pleiotropic transcriptional regulator CodY
MGDKITDKINSILKKNSNGGLTITELVNISKLTRSSIRIALAKLDGAGKISMRKIGMAKVYSIDNQKKLDNWRKKK